MRAQRIVYVCTDPGIPVWGSKGASVHVQAVLRVLVENGADVELVCARTGGEPPADLARVAVRLVPPARGTSVAERERASVASDAALPAVLDSCHRTRSVDLVYERYSLWGRSATAWAATAGVSSILEVNAPLVEEQDRHRGLVDRAGAEEVAGASLSQATAVVCVTEPVAAWARDRAADPRRVHVVGNGVDTRAVRPRPGRLTPPQAPFTLGFVGTLKAWHGVETLVEATAQLAADDPSYRLLVVGDGPRAEALAGLVEERGIAELTTFTGAVSAAEVPGLLHRIDVAVAPYPAQQDCYFSPLKVYEYLAAGLPVVASRIGVLPELLGHGRLGALVEPGSATHLADAVRVLRADVGLRERLRAASVAAAANHDWRHVVARILGLVDLDLAAPRDTGLDPQDREEVRHDQAVHVA